MFSIFFGVSTGHFSNFILVVYLVATLFSKNVIATITELIFNDFCF